MAAKLNKYGGYTINVCGVSGWESLYNQAYFMTSFGLLIIMEFLKLLAILFFSDVRKSFNNSWIFRCSFFSVENLVDFVFLYHLQFL